MSSFSHNQKAKKLTATESQSGGNAKVGIVAETDQRGNDEEYITINAESVNARKTTRLLIVLFGIGIACLWFMIRGSVPQAATAATVDMEGLLLETAIAKLGNVRSEMSNHMDEIVHNFYEFGDVKQVKVDELAKNPFKTDELLGNLGETSAIDEFNISSESLREQAESMQLFSIMKSQQNRCCMIDDKILYVGDSIKGFNVRQIGHNFVTLESEGVEIVLKLLE